MSKMTWGVAVAVVAAIVAGVFAVSQGLLTDKSTTRMVDNGQTATTQTDSPSGSESPDAEETSSPDGDDGEGPDSEEGRVAETAGTDEESAPDTGGTGAAETDEETTPGTDGSREAEADDGRDDAEAALEEEAKSYVEQLGEPSEEPIQMESAAGFASPQQTVESRADPADDSVSQGEPRDIEGGGAESESVEAAVDSPDSETGDDVKRTEVEASEAPTVSAESAPADADAVAPTEASEVAESDAAAAGDGDTGPSEGGTPRVDLPLTEQSPVTLAELLGPEETIPSDAVLYVHTVTPRDTEGIWGIVHEGILQNFARGVAVHRGESTETYQVDIPEDADERRPDNSSSFLGRLIHEKTRQSYVYNYETERVGRDPDLIFPGEEIVIVSFTPDELVSVYKHFVRKNQEGEF